MYSCHLIRLDQSEANIHLEDEGEDEEANHETLIGGSQLVGGPELVHSGEKVSHIHGTLLLKRENEIYNLRKTHLGEGFEIADFVQRMIYIHLTAVIVIRA